MAADDRAAAQACITELTALLSASSTQERAPLLEECEALARAIGAFHMEGIRFRMYNVDRMISRAGNVLPASASLLLEEVRKHLEAAGFHTRSHQAPI
jgi:hypothetical protein